MSMEKEETRKYPRLSFDVEFKHWVLSAPSLKAKDNRGKNISAGGLCMVILEKLKIGTILKLEFSIQDTDKPVITKGKVVWVEELNIYSAETHVSYDCGIEFIDISPQDQENINNHVMLNISQ
jgi:c-di-GMP-binding flagellar brake protein YcgR